MSLRVCAIVPSYNHDRVIGDIVSTLHRLGLTVFVIDDGSASDTASRLAALHDPDHGVRVTRLPVNGGKGRAVSHGLLLADEAGFTHALQVDADGQHDLDVVPHMIELAELHPDALVSGRAMFDQSAPLGRRIGRWITHFWVFVETLSFRITDSMCGLRIYPLAVVRRVLDAEPVGRRMDFDTSIMVRLAWRGVPVVMVPVPVSYPIGNASNFHLWHDNLRITWMHTRLVGAMLARLLSGRMRRAHGPAPERWHRLPELGAYFGIRLCLAIYRLIGRRGCLVLLAPIVSYFYLVSADRRRASLSFLERAFVAGGINRHPTLLDGWRHFMQFGARILDTVIAWTGGMRPAAVEATDPGVLSSFVGDPRGAVVIVSHLGNPDLSRALLDPATRARLLILTHTAHAENYNRLLQEYAPDSVMNVLQVTDISPDVAIHLREHVDRGHWIVIAGDRTPVRSEGRVTLVQFLGAPAPFPQGPYILAALMECPVWLLFCQRRGRGYRLSVERFADRIVLPRQSRNAALAAYAASYASRLQDYVLRDPLQWYNFYDFWAG